MSLYIGLMSGTSMDGIDAALVDVSTNQLIAGITQHYSNEVMQRLEEVLHNPLIGLSSICQLNTLIGRDFALAANALLQKSKHAATDICAIGSHGQTIVHDATATIPYTLQLGCGHTISSLTDITVVADFRSRDLVNGGEGAPFAPLYHKVLFRENKNNVAVVNLGGIANISFISDSTVRGWDIGPANCLMDAWIKLHQNLPYDAEGNWASQGICIPNLLAHLMDDPFIKRQAPKSIGKEYFSLAWLKRYLAPEYKPVDVQATLTAFTAELIAATLKQSSSHIDFLYLCGGGAHNQTLCHLLIKLLPHILIKSSAEAGVDPDYIEAMMFAWLAEQTIKKCPLDLSAITGAKRSSILGAIYLKGSFS